jgi:transposase InsO family protein
MSEAHHPSSEALFRFSIVSLVLGRMRAGEERSLAVRAVAAREHLGFDGSSRRVSERTLYRWLSSHGEAGLEGLERGRRRASSTALPAKLVEYLVAEKRLDPAASVPELIERARAQGQLASGLFVHRSTVYRALERLGLSLARRRSAKDRDSRRFAFPHRLDMVLCDGKHFRAGRSRARRVALFYLDDATRYVLHVVVGTAETAELFLRGLYELIVRYGFSSAFYVDRGPGFIAQDTLAVFAALGIPLLHGEAGYKEGRGKIERFNRTAKADVLRGLDGRPDVDPACGALELRLRHYTSEVYAHRPHESLDGDTPAQRFHADPRPLRFPADEHELRSKFELWLERRVSADHVVTIDSIEYEVPRGHAGRMVTLRRRLLDGSIAFLHEEKLIDLHPVDLASNARSPRARTERDELQPMPPVTAAELAFREDFGPVVQPDGGLELPPSDTDPDRDHPEDTPW